MDSECEGENPSLEQFHLICEHTSMGTTEKIPMMVNISSKILSAILSLVPLPGLTELHSRDHHLPTDSEMYWSSRSTPSGQLEMAMQTTSTESTDMVAKEVSPVMYPVITLLGLRIF